MFKIHSVLDGTEIILVHWEADINSKLYRKIKSAPAAYRFKTNSQSTLMKVSFFVKATLRLFDDKLL